MLSKEAHFKCKNSYRWKVHEWKKYTMLEGNGTPTPVLLPGKSHGWRSLVGCSPWGRWGSDTTERLHFHFSPSFTGEGNGNPLQCSCLENPRDRGVWWVAVYGVSQSRTRLKWLSSSSSSSSSTNQKIARVTILIRGRENFQSRKIFRNKEVHYIIIKGSILQENLTILNVYAPNNRASNYVRQKLIELQGETDDSTGIVADFSIPRSDTDKPSRQKMRTSTPEFSNTVKQQNIITVGSLYLTTTEYTFYSSSRGTFTKTDHILGNKMDHILKIFKWIEIIQCLLLGYSKTKLEINNRKITGNS